jgi:methylmalonyl-CoA mutase
VADDTTLPEIDLSEGFPPATEADWLALVESALKGRDFDKALVSSTYDDIEVRPLYTSRPDVETPVPARQGPWDIRPLVTHPDPVRASAEIDEHRRCGATSHIVRLASAPGRLDGLAIRDAGDAQRFAIGEDICVEAGQMAPAQLVLLDQEAGRQQVRLQSFRTDPVGLLARSGRLEWDPENFIRNISPKAQNVDFISLVADGSVYEEAGASNVQELAAVLATVVHYLRLGTENGGSVQQAADAVRLRLTVSADLFLSIAKMRAGLKMWERVLGASGATASPPTIEAISATGMFTARDPWVNMLRGTAAGMAGAIGGAMQVTILPYSWAAGGPGTEFAQAMARNIQVILNEESNLGAVCDPAAGSFAIEKLTADMADRAWALFQDIERDGGILEALASGKLGEAIAGTVAAKTADAARRKLPVTGVSEFPLLDEDPADLADIGDVEPIAADEPSSGLSANANYAEIASAMEKGDSLGAIVAAMQPAKPLSVAPLPGFRAAQAFEDMRDAADAMMARTGQRPAVFGAFIGPLADFTARATFARNLFAAGGIAVADGPTDASDDDIVAAFGESRASEAVLCSSDEIYADRAAALTRALKAAGAEKVWLAGRGGDREADYAAAGIDGYIYAGCDVVAFLTALHGRLEGDRA